MRVRGNDGRAAGSPLPFRRAPDDRRGVVIMHWKLFVRVSIALVLSVAGCASGSGPNTQPTPIDASSGITGTTRFEVVSGVRGGATTGRNASIEFAIAPVDGTTPVYAKAIFVKSDPQGAFKVNRPPGTYWIGAKEKALDPARYSPRDLEFSEMVVVVRAGAFVTVALVQTGYAP